MFVSLAAAVLSCGLPAQAQLTKGCSGINYLGADTSNPFTAERVVTSTIPDPTGAPKMMVSREIVARDSLGRIRFEKHGVAQPRDDRKTVTLETPDGKPFTVTREEYGTLIEIFDCGSGTFIRIQPGMRIVTVKEDKREVSARRAVHPYSTPYFPRPGSKTAPNVIQEELRTRDIQGIPARGLKTTMLGTEQDGDWNGKPISESELGFRTSCPRRCFGLGRICGPEKKADPSCWKSRGQSQTQRCTKSRRITK